MPAPMQTTEANSRNAQAGLLTYETMELEMQNKKMFACGGFPSPQVGYERLLQEMQGTPSSMREKVSFTPVELRDAMLQNIGSDPGPYLEQLIRLKKDIVEILSSSKGNCLYLSQFKQKYVQRFGRRMDEYYNMVPKGKKIRHFLAELDILELEQSAPKGQKKFLIKLKEPHASQFMMRMALDTAGELSSNSDVEYQYQQGNLDSKVPLHSQEPLTAGKNSAVAAAGPAVVPPDPLDENRLDVRHQSPASATVTLAASPLPLSPPLLPGPRCIAANTGM